jgi:shikimate dehydrogenase
VDLVYGRAETAWVRAARAVGHQAVDGLDMLLEQGALAFEWWFGIPAPSREMQAAMPRESGEVRHPRESGDPC